MKNLLLVLSFLLILSSCTKEFVLDVKSNPPQGGIDFLAKGTDKEGTSVTLNASPSNEYTLDSWSGDASGSSKSTEVIIDGNKNIVANFVLIKHQLSTTVEGEGRITETIVNAGKYTDYDSGTIVRLEAVPSYGYYFTGRSGAITGDTNPVDINMNKPKGIQVTFEKLSYELSVKTQGEGTVTEEIINTGKSTDYEYETTVRLTAIPQEGSDFIEWEESGATTELNPQTPSISALAPQLVLVCEIVPDVVLTTFIVPLKLACVA